MGILGGRHKGANFLRSHIEGDAFGFLPGLPPQSEGLEACIARINIAQTDSFNKKILLLYL